mmetsp:Transcript_64134/g.179420  ORF Transcript_64134/g.179420 Transcript_64134/m.179420 type:complete len:214 (-) Transcript_64134:348-989(-)
MSCDLKFQTGSRLSLMTGVLILEHSLPGISQTQYGSDSPLTVPQSAFRKPRAETKVTITLRWLANFSSTPESYRRTSVSAERESPASTWSTSTSNCSFELLDTAVFALVSVSFTSPLKAMGVNWLLVNSARPNKSFAEKVSLSQTSNTNLSPKPKPESWTHSSHVGLAFSFTTLVWNFDLGLPLIMQTQNGSDWPKSSAFRKFCAPMIFTFSV